MSVPGVVLLGSIREEDVALIAERARAAEVRADPDDELAERLWRELCEARKTNWAGWREPWKLSDGLLLEYVHILTRGKRMHDLLADQVATRVSDLERSLELDILRCCAWAGTANTTIATSRLAHTLSASDANLSRALQRLIQEHLIRSPVLGTLGGLHQLRSEELLQLTHQTVLPTFETSFERAVASVAADGLEPLVADALSARRLPVPSVLSSLIVRLEGEPDARALAAALRGLGVGRVSAGVDEWLDTPEARALPRTQVGSAAMFGIAGVELSDLDVFQKARIAANRLSQIKGSSADDPRRLLVDRLPPSILSTLIQTTDLTSLDEILATFVGVPLPEAIRAALTHPPVNLMNTDLHLVQSILGTLCALDREIAVHWVAEIKQEVLFARIQAETDWAGHVTIEHGDDGVTVRCDLWYVAGSVQEHPHDAVVSLCKLILALCPSADIASSNAITASGDLAGLVHLPLVTKQIPRKNLLPPSIPQWNRRWSDLISRRVAAPSYSDYLTRGVAILYALVPTLEKIFETHFRGKNVPSHLLEALNLLNTETGELTPPAVSALKVSGVGSGNVNTAVSTFQNLLHSSSVSLIKRFTMLPEQAGAYIGWLNDLISDVEIIINEEPWSLIEDSPLPMLARLKALLETLRLLAGEAHERKQSPGNTWCSRGKRAQRGNALKLISAEATASGRKRLAKRQAKFKQLVSQTEVDVDIHVRINPRAILPWPPADVLALLQATDIISAVITLSEQSDSVRSAMDTSTHLTIVPIIRGIVIPALAQSGHQTLFPDFQGAVNWAKTLELQYLPAELSSLFSEIVNLTSEVSTMDQLKLGTVKRPVKEREARQDLGALLAEKRGRLILEVDELDTILSDEIILLLDDLSAESVDFATEAQDALIGMATENVQRVGALNLKLIAYELEAFQLERSGGVGV